MRNHDQKTRDMARSILPSTARRGARHAKQASAQGARARDHARIRRLMGHLDDLDGFEEALDRYDLDISWDGMVAVRREADNVGPLIRWAEARIARNSDLAEGDYWARRNHFATMLGDTVIGRHALQHLDHLFGVENPWLYGIYFDGSTREERRARLRAAARAERDARARRLDEVLAGADAQRLDARIRALTPPIEEHWAIDSRGGRYCYETIGHDPWLLAERGRDRWLAPAHARAAEAQQIAFAALAEVHAEMFGPP